MTAATVHSITSSLWSCADVSEDLVNWKTIIQELVDHHLVDDDDDFLSFFSTVCWKDSNNHVLKKMSKCVEGTDPIVFLPCLTNILKNTSQANVGHVKYCEILEETHGAILQMNNPSGPLHERDRVEVNLFVVNGVTGEHLHQSSAKRQQIMDFLTKFLSSRGLLSWRYWWLIRFSMTIASCSEIRTQGKLSLAYTLGSGRDRRLLCEKDIGDGKAASVLWTRVKMAAVDHIDISRWKDLCLIMEVRKDTVSSEERNDKVAESETCTFDKSRTYGSHKNAQENTDDERRVERKVDEEHNDTDDMSFSNKMELNKTNDPPELVPCVANPAADSPMLCLFNTWLKLKNIIKRNSPNIGPFYCSMKEALVNHNLMSIASPDGFSLLHECVRQRNSKVVPVFAYLGLISKMYHQKVDYEDNIGQGCVFLADWFGAKSVRAEIERCMTMENGLTVNRMANACRAGNVNLFKETLLSGQYSLIREECGMGCLDWAVISGKKKMIRAIMTAERDMGYTHVIGRGYASSSSSFCAPTSFVDENSPCSRQLCVVKTLDLCIALGESSAIQTIVSNIFSPNKTEELNKVQVHCRSLIERAAQAGNMRCFRVLVSLGCLMEGGTFFSEACVMGQFSFVKHCLSDSNISCHVDINYQDRRQRSALHIAIKRGYINIMKELFKHGAMVDIQNKRGRNILHSAAKNGMPKVLNMVVDELEKRRLLEQMLSSNEGRDKHLGSELCQLVRGIQAEHPCWHYVHVDRGVFDIFTKKTSKKTGIGSVNVAAYGHVIRSGWGVNPDKQVQHEVEGMFDMANISSSAAPPDMWPIHLAIFKNNTQCALRLIELMTVKDLNKGDCFNMRPLHYGCMRGNMDVVTALILKGVEVHVRDYKGRLPSKLAETNGHTHVFSKALFNSKLHPFKINLSRRRRNGKLTQKMG